MMHMFVYIYPDECNGDFVWMECGTACLKTCSQLMPVCMEVCAPRCQCPTATPILLNPLDPENPRCGVEADCEGTLHYIAG